MAAEVFEPTSNTILSTFNTTMQSPSEVLASMAFTDTSFMLVLIAVVLVFICVSCVECMGNLCDVSCHKLGVYATDQSHFLLLINTSFRVADLITDIALAYEILLYSQKELSFNYNGYMYAFILGINAVVYIALPYIINWVALTYVIKMKTTSTRPNIWFKKYMFVPVLLILMTGDCYISMKVCCSCLFGSKIFESGHTSIELEKIRKFKIYTIILENIPQIIIQLLYGLWILHHLEPLILVSILFSTLSSVSVLITLICVSKGANKRCQTISYELIVSFENSRSNSHNSKTQELLQIERYRGYKNKLKTELCLLLGVDNAQIEIGYIDLKSNGCIINIVHTIPVRKEEKRDENIRNIIINSYIDNLYQNKLDELCIIVQHIYHLLWHENYNLTISLNGNTNLNANEMNKIKKVAQELVNDIMNAHSDDANCTKDETKSIEIALNDTVDVFDVNYPVSPVSPDINEYVMEVEILMGKDCENEPVHMEDNLGYYDDDTHSCKFKFGDTFVM